MFCSHACYLIQHWDTDTDTELIVTSDSGSGDRDSSPYLEFDDDVE